MTSAEQVSIFGLQLPEYPSAMILGCNDLPGYGHMPKVIDGDCRG